MTSLPQWVRNASILVVGICVGAAGVLVAKASKSLPSASDSARDTLAVAPNCTDTTEQKDDVFFLSCGGIY